MIPYPSVTSAFGANRFAFSNSASGLFSAPATRIRSESSSPGLARSRMNVRKLGVPAMIVGRYPAILRTRLLRFADTV